MKNVLRVHPDDNIIVALENLEKGDIVSANGNSFILNEKIPAKHKFSTRAFQTGEVLIMYGIPVGRTTQSIGPSSLISTENTEHYFQPYNVEKTDYKWSMPDNKKYLNRTFLGYHRSGGKTGTMNYWLVIPLVFCENRNVDVLRNSLLKQLGYQSDDQYIVNTEKLIDEYHSGASEEEILKTEISGNKLKNPENRVFPNVDGIKFLTHEGGCGGTKDDSEMLCKLLASYIVHPNVAGATVLSLGCQHAQIERIQKAVQSIELKIQKPIYYLEQQASRSEREFISSAVKKTFVGLMKANGNIRRPAPLSAITLGLECGGSDGFSGITANPALGYCSDLVVSLGGTAILSEFPELNGVEQELINRCNRKEIAWKFNDLMNRYSARAESAGSGFHQNPSPGNIREGLITDAIKSAGAARKGGTSPVTDVLDYGEVSKTTGLNLLCTPGNDVESTTGLAGAGANIIVFTTGLGTPTGNPVAPVIKMSSNSELAHRMMDIIDINAGTIISGKDTIESKGEELLDLIIKVASGQYVPAAIRLGQEDFIPWKRGISL